MELSHTEAQGRVLGGKYEEALPAAQLSLRCAIDLYGANSVELVPAYLLLAEASVGELHTKHDSTAHTWVCECVHIFNLNDKMA